MKTLLAGFGALVLMLVAVVVYFSARSKEKRSADWKRFVGIPSALTGYFKALFSAKPKDAVVADAPVAAAPAA